MYMTDYIHCVKCKYKTTRITNFRRHKLTRKHKIVADIVSKCEYKCDNCNKSYYHSSGLSRHRKKCLNISDNNRWLDKMDILIEETRVLKRELTNMKHTTTNNFNVNVFLNTTCKGAMNLTDFIDNLKYSLEDLYYSGKNGYVKGVSNILIKNLTSINPLERPLHCSDTKRLKFYIKDGDSWEKDDGNAKMSKSIDYIGELQRIKLKEWETLNPGYDTNSVKSEEFFNIVNSIMGGGDEIELSRNKTQIIKSLTVDTNIKSILGS